MNQKKKKTLNALASKKEGKLLAIASTETKDRMGDVIIANGWDLKNFKRNPVLQFAHDYHQPPIGIVKNIKIEDKRLTFEPVFHEITQLSREIKEMYLADPAIMSAFSVGFIPKEYDEGNRNIIKKAELLEISAVPVPANAEALVSISKSFNDEQSIDVDAWIKKQFLLINKKQEEEKKDENIEQEDEKEIKESEEKKEEKVDEEDLEKEKEIENNDEKNIKEKSVIPYSVHGDVSKSSEDAEWNGSIEVKKASGDATRLRKMHTWVDNKDENFNANERKWYKLPHHKGDGSQEVVWRGVSAAMAALLGARGGVDIPDNDRKGVYNHLKKHYLQYDKEVPEFKEYTDEELNEMFNIEKKEEKVIEIEKGEEIKISENIKKENIELKEKIISLENEIKDIKEGKVISKKNRNLISSTIDSLNKTISVLQDLVNLNEVDENKEEVGKSKDEVQKQQKDVIVQALQKIAKEANKTLHLAKDKNNK